MKTFASPYIILLCICFLWCNEAVADNGKIPLAFTLNQGQLDSNVKFTASGNGCSMFFSPEGTTFLLSREKEQLASKRAAKQSVVYDDDPLADQNEITMEHFALKLQFVNANTAAIKYDTSFLL